MLETEAVLGFLNDIGGEPMVVIGLRIVPPDERPAAFLALERGMDDQLAHVEHVDGIDRVEPLVIRALAPSVTDRHARKEIEPDVSRYRQRRA